MLIDGNSASAAATFGVRNPPTEDIFFYALAADADDLERAVNAATRAFPAWRDVAGLLEFTRPKAIYIPKPKAAA